MPPGGSGPPGASGLRVAGVVLAAGLSSRFGGDLPKQLTVFSGEPLVRRMARQALASRLAEVVVVVGHRGAEVRACLGGLAVRVVDNPCFATGKASSLRAGIAALEPEAAGVMVLPCDQPWLEAAVLDSLLAAFDPARAAIVVPSWRGRRGAPVTFARRFFPALAALEADAGGRDLLPQHAGEVVEVELASEAPLLDVDRASELGGAGPPVPLE